MSWSIIKTTAQGLLLGAATAAIGTTATLLALIIFSEMS